MTASSSEGGNAPINCPDDRGENDAALTYDSLQIGNGSYAGKESVDWLSYLR